MRTRNVAILIFDGVEVLENQGPVIANYNLSVNPSYTLSNSPPLDILLVPGGYGTRKQMWGKSLPDEHHHL